MAKTIRITEERNPEIIAKLNLVANSERITVKPNALARFILNEWLDIRIKELGIDPSIAQSA